MSTKKKFIFTLILVGLISTFSTAVAKKCDDFSQNDYNRLLKGEKNFNGAKLEGANLQGMNLSGFDFRDADLENANLQNANLTNADFEKADLEEANLKYAKIKGAKFKETELEFATWVDGRTCAEGSIGGCW